MARAEDDWEVQHEGKTKEVSDSEDEVSSNEEEEISDSAETVESSGHQNHQIRGGYNSLPLTSILQV